MEYLTNTSELTAVADAIREKGGTSAPLTYPFGFVSAIQDIQTGGGDVKALVEGTLSGTYENSTVTSLGTFALCECRSLVGINFTACSRIGYGAFMSCRQLSSVMLPECEDLNGYAFGYCEKLLSINLSKVQSISWYAFVSCTRLAEVNVPLCMSIGTNAFDGCRSLMTISLPACKTLDSNAFVACGLREISLPECEIIGRNAFSNNKQLSTISFPKCTTIGDNAFYSCYSLRSAYFMGSSLVTLQNYNAFDRTPISNYDVSSGYGSIYVPASLLTDYQAATNWVRYSSRFVGV